VCTEGHCAHSSVRTVDLYIRQASLTLVSENMLTVKVINFI